VTSGDHGVQVLHVHRRAFEDFVAIDGVAVGEEVLVEINGTTGVAVVAPCVAGTRFSQERAGETITFSYQTRGIELRKTFTPADDGWQVEYRFVNRSAVARNVEIRTAMGLSPDSLTILSEGREALEAAVSGLAARVLNRRRGLAVAVDMMAHPPGEAAFSAVPMMFGHLVGARLQFELEHWGQARACYRLRTEIEGIDEQLQSRST
jgi:hypothetical protein